MFQIYNEDCFETFKRIKSESVDLVLCDPPYGTTQCKWDSIIPLESMWRELKKIVKKSGCISLCCQEPFTSVLVCSYLSKFRYKWVWEKVVPTGHLNSGRMPMKWYEEVAIFYSSLPTYNPQLREGTGYSVKLSNVHSKNYNPQRNVGYSINDGSQYKPKDIIGPFKNVNGGGKFHPTQKPVELMEYLIRTYTDPGDTVLDFAMGSGTTGVACGNLGRRFIGCDKDTEFGYFEIAKKRIEEAYGVKRKPPKPIRKAGQPKPLLVSDCIACSGTGRSSAGGGCAACDGTGKPRKDPWFKRAGE